ncbi:MAG: LamG-like jellyroll fold domain-containing protein [Terrimicrobiaceae bacterium]
MFAKLPALFLSLALLLNAGLSLAAEPEASAETRFANAMQFSPTVPWIWTEASASPEYVNPPLSVECRARLISKAGFNVLVANEPKDSANHWELYTEAGSGKLSAYLPGWSPNTITSDRDVVDGKWHFLAMTFSGDTVVLYVDGSPVTTASVTQRSDIQPMTGELTVGKAAAQGAPPGDTHGCDGQIGEVRVSKVVRAITGVPQSPLEADADTIGLWRFSNTAGSVEFEDFSPLRNPMRVIRLPRKSLDEIDRESFKAGPSPLDSPAEDVVLSEGSAELPSGATVVSLDGKWQMAEGGEATTRLEGEWQDSIPAEVPGSVHTALEKAGKIPDPKFGLNDAIAREKSFKTWWMKTTFPRPANLQGGKLVFGGVAVKCTVWLNGQELGSHEGAFGGPEFDVAGHLKDQNTLIVKIWPAPYVKSTGQPNSFFTDMNVGWLYTVTFNNVYGWHYSNIPSIGIWRSVRLKGAPEVRLNHPFIATRDAQLGTMDLMSEMEGPAKGWAGKLVGVIEPDNFKGQSYHFTSDVQADGARKKLHLRFAIPDPQLWWPNGVGDPNLYRLKLAFIPEGGGISDVKQVSFGIRTVEMAPLPHGPDPNFCNWTFVINKRPQFVKGTGWCTMDSSMDFSRERYEHLMKLAKLQHVQMFRAWGSGMPETDDFYDLCNRYGIMVMQEWPTAWNSHKEGFQPYELLEETVRLNTLRLRNNPSLVMWGGGNESSDFQGKAIDMMGRYSIEMDGTRPFHRGEAYGGSTHNYDCDWGQKPLDAALGVAAPFIGEFGMRSMPVYESVQRYLPDDEKNLWPAPDGGSFAYHTPVFNTKGDMAMLRKFAGYFSEGKTMEEFCTASQVAATTCVRHTLEHARTRWPESTGALYYKMNDNYPAASWASVDWYGAPKMNHYFFEQAFAPLHACILFSTFNMTSKPTTVPEFVPGKFGNAIQLAKNYQEVAIPGGMKDRPLTFECWVKLDKLDTFNIIMSVARKDGKHWEIMTPPGSGAVAVYMPEVGTFGSSTQLKPGQWHYLAFRLEKNGFKLYVDGKLAIEKTVPKELVFDDQPLILGGIRGEGMACNGAIDELVVSRRTDSLEGAVPTAPAAATTETLAVFHLDSSEEVLIKVNPPAAPALPVYLLDDADALKSGGAWEVVARAYDSQLAEIKRESFKGTGAIDRVAKLGEFKLTLEQASSEPLLFVVEVRRDGVLADRTFYWTNYELVKDGLFKLPKTSVSLEVKDGKAIMKNTGKLPAVGVNVGRTGHADTFYADANYFWLDPGETKSVKVNETEGLKVSGWNL